MFNPFDEFPHTIEIGEVEVQEHFLKNTSVLKVTKQLKDLWIRLHQARHSNFIK